MREGDYNYDRPHRLVGTRLRTTWSRACHHSPAILPPGRRTRALIPD